MEVSAKRGTTEKMSRLRKVIAQRMKDSLQNSAQLTTVIEVDVTRLVGRLEVTVQDDGRGLPEGFDLDASTNLGLSIVRTLVESELGGRLTVDTAPSGRGTRVMVDVPLT